MIDTLEIGYFLGEVGEAERAEFARSVPGHLLSRCDATSGEARETSRYGEVPGLGVVNLRADGYMRLGGSLAKYAEAFATGRDLDKCHNEDVLSAAAADATFQALAGRVEETFGFAYAEGLNVTRADVVYQRTVRSSAVKARVKLSKSPK